MARDQFLLRWEEFEANISSALQDLRHEEELYDVTLVCDEEEIYAHKIILSACSPLFRRLLSKLSRNPHPIVYLRGVRAKELMTILDFIYHGKVSVPQEDLPAMLSLAADLHIKGLSESKTQNLIETNGSETNDIDVDEHPIVDEHPDVEQTPIKGELNSKSCDLPAKRTARKSFPKQKDVVPYDAIFECEDVQEITYSDAGTVEYQNFGDYEEEEEEEDTTIIGDNLEAPPHDDTNKDQILDAMVESICVKRSHYHGMGTVYECGVCRKIVKKKEKMRCHAEKHIKGFTHQCSYCGKHYRTRPSLKVHISIAHKLERQEAVNSIKTSSQHSQLRQLAD